ncbi:MAG: phospholipid:lipid A palmitoyltransferase, partial [Achromobacter spanius]
MTAQFRAAMLCLLLSTFTAAAQACESMPSWAQSACNRIDQIWTEGGNDLYVSGFAWHNRAMYSKVKIDSFNEL